jgi:dienelactone hydrolase
MNKQMYLCVVAFATAGFIASFSGLAAANSSTLKVGVDHCMRAFLITPDGPGPYPAVLVLHTSGGLKDADVEYAERLSKEGYVCLVPAFLEAYNISYKQRQLSFTGDAKYIYADFVDALDTLRHTDKVNAGKLGAIGFSNGG